MPHIDPSSFEIYASVTLVVSFTHWKLNVVTSLLVSPKPSEIARLAIAATLSLVLRAILPVLMKPILFGSEMYSPGPNLPV